MKQRTTTSRLATGAALGIALAALLGVAACGSSTQNGAGGGGSSDTLTVAIPGNPSSLDPQAGAAGTDHEALYPIYATLVDFDPTTLKPAPGLAESWSFTNPTTLQLKLRSGLKFSDGSPLDAKAVKASLQRYKGQTNGEDLDDVTSVDAPDATTVVIHEKTPDTSLVLVLADRAGMIVGPTASQPDFAQKPVGAGPYELVSYRPGESITYKRNPNYYGNPAPIANLVMKIMTDPKAAANALISGQIDFADQLDPDDLSRLKGDSNLTVLSPETLYFEMIYLNLSQKPLDDPRVRQAINIALDRDEIVQGAVDGAGKPAYQPVPETSWAYDPQADTYWKHDDTKAKQLLADAGYSNGLTITACTVSSPVYVRLNEIIRDELSKVGITYKVTPMDVNECISQYFEKHAFSAAEFGWSGRPDPAQTFNRLFAKTSYQNPGQVETPGLTPILNKAVATTDTAKRQTFYAQADKILADFAPYVPIYFHEDVTAYSKKVTGYTANLLGKPKVSFLSKSGS